MPTSYDLRLVALSVVIAMAASVRRSLTSPDELPLRGGRARATWLIGGACIMGFDIWSMHYIGMHAFTLPVLVQYDLPTVWLSLLAAALLAAGIALFVVSRVRLGPGQAPAPAAWRHDGRGDFGDALRRYGGDAHAGRRLLELRRGCAVNRDRGRRIVWSRCGWRFDSRSETRELMYPQDRQRGSSWASLSRRCTIPEWRQRRSRHQQSSATSRTR